MIDFLKMTKKERIIFYIAALLIILAFVDRCVYRVIRVMFAEVREKTLVEAKKVGANLRNLAQKDIISAEYKKFSGFLTPIASDEEEISTFLRTIEETARSANVYITDIKPQATASVAFYKKYIVEINTETTLEQMIDFIYRLESLNQLITIEQLRLTAKTENSKMLKASVTTVKILIP